MRGSSEVVKIMGEDEREMRGENLKMREKMVGK